MEVSHDNDLATRLRRLDAGATGSAPPFGYDDLVERQGIRANRARRRRNVTRATAGVLVIAMIGASVWRLEPRDVGGPVSDEPPAVAAVSEPAEPRLVRADTYLAVAALEDHIARVDDALNVARLYSPRGAEVARLERTRSELLDSYARVRYAEMVSANF